MQNIKQQNIILHSSSNSKENKNNNNFNIKTVLSSKNLKWHTLLEEYGLPVATINKSKYIISSF
jgi:hypothetical protein